MSIVNSVLGPLDTAKLGFTLMHEHIQGSGMGGIPENFPEIFEDGWKEIIVKGLTEAKKVGVDTIVDATPLSDGRDVNLLAEVSRLSGVNIIASSGWLFALPGHFLSDPHDITMDNLTQVFTREIQKGIGHTAIKAGIYKAGSGAEGVTTDDEVVLRAVARAHLKTHAPIMLHSDPVHQVGRQQVAILKEEGVDLRRVKIDHSTDGEKEYLLWLLEQGCYLGIDRYPGMDPDQPARIKRMKVLIDAGYADRLLPSHDWLLESPEGAFFWVKRKERLAINPNYGFVYMKTGVIPELRKLGVSDAILNRLCVIGPRNFFEGV